MEDVALAKTGHRDAFARLVVRHQNQMCGVALAIVRDVALSEDVAQEAFVRAWRALPGLRDDGAFVAWLRQTTRRLAIDAWRARQKQNALRDAPPEPAAAAADEAAERAQQCAFVSAALAELADDDREILIAHLREDLSLREMAARFAVSEVVAQKRLSRARQRLQEKTEARLAKGLRKTAPAAAFALAVLAGLDAQAAPLAAPGARPRWLWTVAAAGGVAAIAFLSHAAIEHPTAHTQETALATLDHASDIAAQKNPCPSSRAFTRAEIKGFNDDAAGIAEARAAWQADPKAFDRVVEIASYDRRQQEIDPNERKAVQLAMIERCANSPSFIDLHFGRKLDPDIVSAWQVQLAQAQNTLPSRRAARYFLFADNPRAQALLAQAFDSDTKDPYLKLDLVEAEALAHPSDTQARQKAMRLLSEEIRDRTVLILGLYYLALEALDAGEGDEATRCADEMLAFSKTRDASFSVHRNNMILGQVALEQNDLTAAKKHLLAEGDASPSAHFAVDFPPLTALADQLLARGEREVVLAYLEKVRAFWSDPDHCLDAWRARIEENLSPQRSERCDWGERAF